MEMRLLSIAALRALAAPARAVMVGGNGSAPETCRARPLAAVTFALIALSGCTTLGPRLVSETVADILRDHTTKSALLRAEPLLTSLKPGDHITFDTLKFKLYKISSLVGGTTLVAAADGWISAGSGGICGALDGFGRLFARSVNTVYGRHVFGYIWYDQTVVPSYELITEAVPIGESEYKQLQSQRDSDIGERPTETGAHLYFKQVRMHELKELPFREAYDQYQESELTFKETTEEEYREALFAVYSRESFDKAATILGGIPPGTDTWGVVKALDGKFKTVDYGRSYALFMNGFANYERDHRWFKVAPSAFYEVWPFGFVQDKVDVFRLNAVFRNGKLLKVLPYASREALERTFVD